VPAGTHVLTFTNHDEKQAGCVSHDCFFDP
jgi:hypothetical protein